MGFLLLSVQRIFWSSDRLYQLFIDASYWSRKAETGLCEQTVFKIASCRRQPCVPGCFSGHCDLAKPALRPPMFFRRLASYSALSDSEPAPQPRPFAFSYNLHHWNLQLSFYKRLANSKNEEQILALERITFSSENHSTANPVCFGTPRTSFFPKKKAPSRDLIHLSGTFIR